MHEQTYQPSLPSFQTLQATMMSSTPCPMDDSPHKGLVQRVLDAVAPIAVPRPMTTEARSQAQVKLLGIIAECIHARDRPMVTPIFYGGSFAAWIEFTEDFKAISTLNGWNDHQASMQLRRSLQGTKGCEIRDRVPNYEDLSFPVYLEALSSVFVSQKIGEIQQPLLPRHIFHNPGPAPHDPRTPLEKTGPRPLLLLRPSNSLSPSWIHEPLVVSKIRRHVVEDRHQTFWTQTGWPVYIDLVNFPLFLYTHYDDHTQMIMATLTQFQPNLYGKEDNEMSIAYGFFRIPHVAEEATPGRRLICGLLTIYGYWERFLSRDIFIWRCPAVYVMGTLASDISNCSFRFHTDVDAAFWTDPASTTANTATSILNGLLPPRSNMWIFRTKYHWAKTHTKSTNYEILRVILQYEPQQDTGLYDEFLTFASQSGEATTSRPHPILTAALSQGATTSNGSPIYRGNLSTLASAASDYIDPGQSDGNAATPEPDWADSSIDLDRELETHIRLHLDTEGPVIQPEGYNTDSTSVTKTPIIPTARDRTSPEPTQQNAAAYSEDDRTIEHQPEFTSDSTRSSTPVDKAVIGAHCMTQPPRLGDLRSSDPLPSAGPSSENLKWWQKEPLPSVGPSSSSASPATTSVKKGWWNKCLEARARADKNKAAKENLEKPAPASRQAAAEPVPNDHQPADIPAAQDDVPRSPEDPGLPADVENSPSPPQHVPQYSPISSADSSFHDDTPPPSPPSSHHSPSSSPSSSDEDEPLHIFTPPPFMPTLTMQAMYGNRFFITGSPLQFYLGMKLPRRDYFGNNTLSLFQVSLDLRKVIVTDNLVDELNMHIARCDAAFKRAIGQSYIHSSDLLSKITAQMSPADPLNYKQLDAIQAQGGILCPEAAAMVNGDPFDDIPTTTISSTILTHDDDVTTPDRDEEHAVLNSILNDNPIGNPDLSHRYGVTTKYLRVLRTIHGVDQDQTVFTYGEVTRLTALYIAARASRFFAVAPSNIANIRDSVMSQAFGVKIFHRRQLTKLMRRQLYEPSNPDQQPTSTTHTFRIRSVETRRTVSHRSHPDESDDYEPWD